MKSAEVLHQLNFIGGYLWSVGPVPFDTSCFCDTSRVNRRGTRPISRLVGPLLYPHLLCAVTNTIKTSRLAELSHRDRAPRAFVKLFTALHGMQTRSYDENLSVRSSVCLSNACIVTKRKKDMFTFLYHTKDHLSQFSEKKNGW